LRRLLQKAVLEGNDPILLISGLSNSNPTVNHSESGRSAIIPAFDKDYDHSGYDFDLLSTSAEACRRNRIF
jgi:hypothetical protein